MKPELTIAIPTFNRAARLKAQLDRLAPQLTPDVRCCVYDNASTDETPQVVAGYGSLQISCFRSAYNCGLFRNLLRCFEECETEWLWILSDDDPISPRAVSDILGVIRNQPVDFIHTSTPLCRHDSEIMVSTVEPLLQHATLSSLFLISAGIYRMPAFHPFMPVFASSLSTWVPQTAMVLALLEAKRGKALLSKVSVVAEFPGTPRFSTLDFIIHLCQLPEYLTQPFNQQLVAGHIWEEHVHWALLMGLRETGEPAQIRKWLRIRKQVQQNLKAYHAPPPWAYAARNWFRAGHRKEALATVHNAFALFLLGHCPVALFNPLLRAPFFPNWARRHLDRHKKEYTKTNY